MSTSVTVDPVIGSIVLLINAISDLQMARQEIKELETCHGKREVIDFAFQNEFGDTIGVREKNGQVQLVTQTDSPTVKQTLDKVKQAYARVKILDEVKRKGYQQVKEERLSDGSIRMVVQKWR